MPRSRIASFPAWAARQRDILRIGAAYAVAEPPHTHRLRRREEHGGGDGPGGHPGGVRLPGLLRAQPPPPRRGPGRLVHGGLRCGGIPGGAFTPAGAIPGGAGHLFGAGAGFRFSGPGGGLGLPDWIGPQRPGGRPVPLGGREPGGLRPVCPGALRRRQPGLCRGVLPPGGGGGGENRVPGCGTLRSGGQVQRGRAVF